MSEPTSHPETESAATAPPVTILLRPEDAAYANPEQSLRVLPRTTTVWNDLRALIAAGARLLAARSAIEIEDRIVGLALAEFPAETVSLTLAGPQRTRTATRSGAEAEVSESMLDLVLRAQEERAGILRLASGTAMSAPLLAGGELIGVVALESAPGTRRLDKHHLQLLIGLAALAAPALAAALEREKPAAEEPKRRKAPAKKASA